MHPVLRRSLTVVVATMALVSASCGVAADDTAATFEGAGIPTSLVDALAADEAFAALIGFPLGESTSVVDGTSARAALDFLLQAEALAAEARSQGLDVRPDDTALRATIEGLQGQGYTFGIDDLGPEARRVLSGAVAADQALAAAGADFGAPTPADLRFVYDLTVGSGRWDRTCVTVLAGPPEATADVDAAIAGGASLAEVPERVPEMQLAIDAGQQCASGADLDTLPEELGDAISGAEPGEVVGAIEVADAQQPLAVYFVVESSATLSFEEARAELEPQVAQSMLAVRIARGTEVNPRYGDGVVLETVTSQAGQSTLTATVGRPQAPAAPPALPVDAP